jgi:hypothetical protein
MLSQLLLLPVVLLPLLLLLCLQAARQRHSLQRLLLTPCGQNGLPTERHVPDAAAGDYEYDCDDDDDDDTAVNAAAAAAGLLLQTQGLQQQALELAQRQPVTQQVMAALQAACLMLLWLHCQQ